MSSILSECACGAQIQARGANHESVLLWDEAPAVARGLVIVLAPHVALAQVDHLPRSHSGLHVDAFAQLRWRSKYMSSFGSRRRNSRVDCHGPGGFAHIPLNHGVTWIGPPSEVRCTPTLPTCCPERSLLSSMVVSGGRVRL